MLAFDGNVRVCVDMIGSISPFLVPTPVHHWTGSAESYAACQQRCPQRVTVTVTTPPGQVIETDHHHGAQHQDLTKKHDLTSRTLLTTAWTPGHDSLTFSPLFGHEFGRPGVELVRVSSPFDQPLPVTSLLTGGQDFFDVVVSRQMCPA